MKLFRKDKTASPPILHDYEPAHGYKNRIGDGTGRAADCLHKRLISLITVTLNSEKTLEKTIRSVLRQTYDTTEHIIIDGGSTDNTLAIIKKYSGQLAYWASEPDKGISDAFNKGIAASSGDIIGIINADDWYNENAVRCADEQFCQSEADIVYGNLQLWDNDLKTELLFADHKQIEFEMTMNHPSIFVRRSAYEKIGLFRTDFRYAMDYEWLLRAKHHGLRFHYANDVFANMRLDGRSNRYWKQTEWEAAKARKIYAPHKSHYPFFLFQIAKGTARRSFERIHLHALVAFYHRHISRVKKIKVR